MKEIERRVEKLERRIIEKALSIDATTEIEKLLAERKLLEEQRKKELSPLEFHRVQQEENAEVLEWYREYLEKHGAEVKK